MPDQSDVKPDTEVRTKAIGAFVVSAAVGFSVLAFYIATSQFSIDPNMAELLSKDEATRTLVQSQLANRATTVAATFGALTTFLGTAVGAYFGISAAQSSVRSLSQPLEKQHGWRTTSAEYRLSIEAD